MRFLSSFEKHRFKSSTKTTLLAKLSIAIYLTTVCPLPVYMREFMTLSGRSAVAEISPFYYLLFTMTCTAVISHPIIQLLKIPYYLIKRRFVIKQAKTQEELNEAFLPPKYKYEDSYANHLVYVMIGVSFCGLFPVVIFVAMLGLFISYFVDKLASKYIMNTI
jgi:hypothetical protein